ncbi:MAG: hypothetical protein IJ399_03595 [Bacilli bacterium]|nr:hypothetical protein [Bacilli bacterium]
MSKYKNNVILCDDCVLKKYNQNVLEIYSIFDMCGFDNYCNILSYDEEYIRYELLKCKNCFERIRGIDFINVVALMHDKTQKYIDVDSSKYKNIYDLILGNINYLKEYYDNMIESIEFEKYMKPSSYLIARNYSIIVQSLDFASSSLEKWFKSVENNLSDRVCVVHNNLSLDHFIFSDKPYLISFDRAMVDTPVLDLYILYKKEFNNLNFDLLFNEYNNIFALNDNEKLLFYVLISITPKIEIYNDEFNDCININYIFKYIYKTLKFINKNNNLQV